MLQVLFSLSSLKDLTPTAEMKASSRQAMIGSLSGQDGIATGRRENPDVLIIAFDNSSVIISNFS